eukprot:m51a1_g9868 hypothetical protein (266) ;mRNA; r:71860-73028
MSAPSTQIIDEKEQSVMHIKEELEAMYCHCSIRPIMYTWDWLKPIEELTYLCNMVRNKHEKSVQEAHLDSTLKLNMWLCSFMDLFSSIFTQACVVNDYLRAPSFSSKMQSRIKGLNDDLVQTFQNTMGPFSAADITVIIIISAVFMYHETKAVASTERQPEEQAVTVRRQDIQNGSGAEPSCINSKEMELICWGVPLPTRDAYDPVLYEASLDILLKKTAGLASAYKMQDIHKIQKWVPGSARTAGQTIQVCNAMRYPCDRCTTT